MRKFLLIVLANLGSFGISEVIHNYVNNEYVKAYKEMASKYNIDEKKKIREVEYINKEYMIRLGIYRVLPVINVIITLTRLLFIKNNVKYIEEHPEMFFPEMMPHYQQMQEKTGVIEDGKKKEYYVGYFDNNKPIIIYFSFDGQDLIILDTSAKSFLELPEDVQYNQLLYILYAIMIGKNNSLISCNNIYEIFNNDLANTLYDKFEMGNDSFEVITEDYPRIRKK